MNLRATLDDLGRRLALAIVRPDVIALRRLLVGEAREFPALAAQYFDQAPGQVLEALASGFERLGKSGLLRVADARLAAAQFAYLLVGEPLDRAVLVGDDPAESPRRRRRTGRGRDVPRSLPAAGQDPQRVTPRKVNQNPGLAASSIAASHSRLSRSRERVRTARLCPALL